MWLLWQPKTTQSTLDLLTESALSKTLASNLIQLPWTVWFSGGGSAGRARIFVKPNLRLISVDRNVMPLLYLMGAFVPHDSVRIVSSNCRRMYQMSWMLPQAFISQEVVWVSGALSCHTIVELVNVVWHAAPTETGSHSASHRMAVMWSELWVDQEMNWSTVWTCTKMTKWINPTFLVHV